MGIVYFAHDDGRVKIGYSRRMDPRFRVHELNQGSGLSLKLIGTISGTLLQEKALHGALEDHRIRREWYRDSAELRHIIGRALVDLDGAIHNPDGVTTNFAKVVRALWPEDPAGVLALEAGCTRAQAFMWLGDMDELPARIVAVIMQQVVPVRSAA